MLGKKMNERKHKIFDSETKFGKVTNQNKSLKF